MDANRLVEVVTHYMPSASPAEVLCMSMLICHHVESIDSLEMGDDLESLVRDLNLQLSLHEDQHAAIAEDLDSLASTEPTQFNVQHLWTLIRAIKVQSQLLNFYIGPASVTLETVSQR